jgi:hypothetical protein
MEIHDGNSVYVVSGVNTGPNVKDNEYDSDSDNSIYNLEKEILDLRVEQASAAQREYIFGQEHGNSFIYKFYKFLLCYRRSPC